MWVNGHSNELDVATRQVALCLLAVACTLLLAGSGVFAARASAVTPARVPETTNSPRGYPMLLSADRAGGVWFGGATDGSGRPESVDRIDYITPTGAFVDVPFPPELYGYWPEAFAPAQGGGEWFLARQAGNPTPLLGEVSPLGQITTTHIQVPAGSAVRGLTVGVDGDLWMTDTQLADHKRTSAILKVAPSGKATAYTSGLRRGAIPENITSGSGGAMWFVDTAGRIGRVAPTGRITEFPVRHKIDGIGTFGPPPPIITASDGAVWFVLDQRSLGRMTRLGQVQIFSPRTSLAQSTSDEEEGIEALAPGRNGSVWFTQRSGSVLRIAPSGHVHTVTKRLVQARGIAVASNGTVWVGEEASFRPEDSETVIPTRVARIGVDGGLTQYPEPPVCHVPFVLGYGPSYAAQLLRESYCELAGIRRPSGSRSNHLIVVSQSVHAGAVVPYKSPVRVELGPKPPPPSTCRAPRYVHVLVDSPKLILWKNPIAEPDNTKSNSEGAQTYIACVPGHRAKHVFMTEETDLESFAGLKGLHTAGHFIAFTASSADHYNSGDNEIAVYDALRGRRVFTAAYPFSEGSPGAIVPEFAVDSLGEVAWIKQEAILATVDSKPVQTGERVLLQAHYGGHTHTIEAAAGDISHISLHAHVLQWTSSGQAHSITLR
jgi:streptogramin lyase